MFAPRIEENHLVMHLFGVGIRLAEVAEAQTTLEATRALPAMGVGR